MKKIGLALGGGGARGLAHIGVLRVLERERIPVNVIAGTSMGAIIGACYAVKPDIRDLEQRVRDALSASLFADMKFNLFKADHEKQKDSFFKRARDFLKNGYIHLVEQTRHSLLELDKLQSIINMLLPDIDIRETRIPFSCVATDLTNGVSKVFSRGPLRRCVLASASIPGIFPPVEIDGVYYSDGGSVQVTPVLAAREGGAGFIVASDVKSRMLRWDKPDMAGEIVSRCNYITGLLLNDIHLKEADVVIAPAVKTIHWSEFNKLDLLIREGERAAATAMLGIKIKTMRSSLKDRLFTLVAPLRRFLTNGSFFAK